MSVDEAQQKAENTKTAGKKVSLQDCKALNIEEDCWLVISGIVYDVTEFLDEHPGGFDIVLAATGNHAACSDANSLDICASVWQCAPQIATCPPRWTVCDQAKMQQRTLRR